MRQRRILGWALALLLVLGCAGCGGETAGGKDGTGLQVLEELSAGSGLAMAVDRASGAMTILRPGREETAPMGEDGTWTIFLYLCGSDLESDEGSASLDLAELAGAAESGRVRFVIQTGGSLWWDNGDVDPDRSQRFVAENGGLTLVDDGPRAGMGRGETLGDFLRWGVETYPADRMGVILWDHGGGSITGVCFDEQDEYDSLTLRELDAAFLSAYEGMTEKFALVAFDACLMATVETANILASYADYMVASQESIPGEGFDYKAIGDFLAADPAADGAALGEAICESYLSACREYESDGIATLSLVDLAAMDGVVMAFNDFAREMYEAGEDASVRAEMVRNIWQADNYGGNDRVDGYANMVDLGGLIDACAAWSEAAPEALAALEEAVVFSVAGMAHPDASGLSVYYPLCVQGSGELNVFSEICVSPYYLSFVDRQARGEEETGYSDSHWFSGGIWAQVAEYLLQGGTYSYRPGEDPYWDFADSLAVTGASEAITFAEEPALDEDGIFGFRLDGNGLDNAADVYALVYQVSPDGETYYELGETYDVEADWETGVFRDWFDGYWISLPDGQELATYIAGDGEDCTYYASPVLVNGRETSLRLRQDWEDGTVTAEGLWDGIDENGAAARDTGKLEPGDVIVPLYYSVDARGAEETFRGEPYTVGRTLEPVYDLLEPGDYLYAFCVDDVYGDYYETDAVLLCVEEDGEVTYYE